MTAEEVGSALAAPAEGWSVDETRERYWLIARIEAIGDSIDEADDGRFYSILDEKADDVGIDPDKRDTLSTADLRTLRKVWEAARNDFALCRERGPLPLDEIATAQQYDDPDIAKAVRRELVRKRARELAIELTSPADNEPIGCFLSKMPETERPVARVEGLLNAGGRLVVIAQKKAGKTHLTLNLLRDIREGESFLGRFPTTRSTRNVGWLNYELDDDIAKRWAKEIGGDPARLYIANLRGRVNPLGNENGRARLVADLVAHDVEVLLVDTWAKAFTGDNLNDTSQAVRWCSLIDAVAFDAGVGELIVTNHTGWDTTRGRNSTVLEDWADTIAHLNKDDQERRYFKATGRDIDVPEDRLDYDPITRRLTLTGDGSATQARVNATLDKLAETLVEAVADNPGRSLRDIERTLKADGVAFRSGELGQASRLAERRGLVRIEAGPRNAKLHYLTSAPDCSPPLPGNGVMTAPTAYLEGAVTREHSTASASRKGGQQ